MIIFQRRRSSKTLLVGMFFLAADLGLFINPFIVGAETSDRLADCAKIEDDSLRLQCFDKLAGGNHSAPRIVDTAAASMPAAKEVSSEPEKPSVMTKQWDLDSANRSHSFVIRPYRMNYFLPVAYNSSPNDETNLEYDPAAKAQFNEAKFQLSFKVKAWEDVLQEPLQGLYDQIKVVKGVDVWVAYTQLSFWQLYNSAFSSPFRDINYEPELLINLRTD
jgi:phospholipase A1